MSFESRLKLEPGQRLENRRMRTKGHLGETEIEEFDVVSAAGDKVGRVTYTEHTQVRGLKTTHHVEQYDSTGQVVVDQRW